MPCGVIHHKRDLFDRPFDFCFLASNAYMKNDFLGARLNDGGVVRLIPLIQKNGALVPRFYYK